MALADGLLNSFFFYPAILAAGALPRPEHCKPVPAARLAAPRDVRI
jgi:hypothetical protein